METNSYRINTVKWLPFVDTELKSWYNKLIVLHNTTKILAENIASIIHDISHFDKMSDTKTLSTLPDNLERILEDYKSVHSISSTINDLKSIHRYKMNYLLTNLGRLLNIITRFTYNLINQIVDCEDEKLILISLRLIKIYNEALTLEFSNITDKTINIFSNDCPSILESLKNVSIIRILQIVAKNKAEDYCHELINTLLQNYESYYNIDNVLSTNSGDLDINENSSAEVYRALTTHISPPNTMSSKISGSRNNIHTADVESFKILAQNQLIKIEKFIKVAKDISPELFHFSNSPKNNNKNNIHTNNNTNNNDNNNNNNINNVNYGKIKIKKSTLSKVFDYYQQAQWASISEILDHVILWWSTDGIAIHHHHGAHYLRDWLQLFLQTVTNVPINMKPTLQTLCDALGCHITTTSWDELFRLAYIASFKCTSRPCSSESTDTGQMFTEVFQLLVSLANECEMSGEWVAGAPLMELPVSEQILILHRLDHSIHTMRLWASHESKIIAHSWDLQSFFLLVKGDLKICITELSHLKLVDHVPALAIDSISVQVYVCVKMRAKIVSEVNGNITLLKEEASKCIDTLAKICRIVCLANLHMCFPPPNYWRRASIVVNISTSPYVHTYLEQVLLPVLEVVEDHEISNMVLRIMCEAWLDYIYLHRIKFNELGAYQLLTDFAYVTEWVTQCQIISQNVKDHLLKNEVLRRCEGVGRLLLRHPGEAINMKKRIPKRSSETDSPESLGLERMPAEMYVPNQEQWLELRAEGYFKLRCCC